MIRRAAWLVGEEISTSCHLCDPGVIVGEKVTRGLRTYKVLLVRGHVDEAAVMALEGHGDRGRGTVTVLGHDQVGLARSG
ncbi:hypothetical protein GCM10023075_19830 [Streptosporangium album]